MKFNKTTVPNGMRIVTIPMPGSPSVTVLVMVEAGSKYETKNINGLSHFLEHMCFKGTARRPKAIDISRELDAIGAEHNAFTSQEFTGYYAKAHPKHAAKILDVIADMYQNPIFDEKEIEKEKGVIIEEINMYEDMPQRHVHDLFMELLYGDQPAGWNIAGLRENIRAMTRADFVKYRENHYVASATTVFVAGDFNEAKMRADIEKLFAGVSSGAKQPKLEVIENQDKPAILIQKKDTDQSHLVLGVRSYSVWDKRIPILNVLNAVLGGGMSGRLFQKLRDEMGVAYYVRSANDAYTDHGVLTVSAGVTTARLAESVSAIVGELRRFCNEAVPEEELRKAKDYIAGTLYLGLESSDEQAMFTAEQEILKREILTPDAVLKKIEAVTADDVQRVARQIMLDKNLNCAVVTGSANKAVLIERLRF